MTPEDLRAQAAKLREDGEEAQRQGDDRRAAVCFLQALMRMEAAAELERLGKSRLPRPVKARTFHEMLSQDERGLAISEGHPAPDNSLKKAARAKKMSLSALSRAVNARGKACSPALLTMAYKGERPMPSDTADVIAELIDFPKSRWRHLS